MTKIADCELQIAELRRNPKSESPRGSGCFQDRGAGNLDGRGWVRGGQIPNPEFSSLIDRNTEPSVLRLALEPRERIRLAKGGSLNFTHRSPGRDFSLVPSGESSTS